MFRTATIRVRLEHGILFVSNCSSCERSASDARYNLAVIERARAGLRRPMLMDMTLPAKMSPECQLIYATEGWKHVTALAMVTPSMMARVIGNLLMALNTTPLPVKLFNNRDAAMSWLNGHLWRDRALANTRPPAA